jgi:hypothetical protein
LLVSYITRLITVLFSKEIGNPLNLDSVDDRLLTTFADSFPRPIEIPICTYDVDRAEMIELCAGNRVYENSSLICNFVSNNRWGMFGDWSHFPPFAGDVAVYARRNGFDHEHDLLFYYLHTCACGSFPDTFNEWLLTPNASST